MTDTEIMQIAVYLALRAKGRTSPNPLVGSILVKGNKIVAEGWHRRCGAAHAEAEVLKKAGRSAKGSKLYVTLEPCHHQGRTPPCIDQIIESGVKEVIIGMKDPNPLTNGRSIKKLKKAGVKTKVGVLQDECEQVNEAFIKYMKTKMPFVVAKSAQTLDGKIATSNGHSKWITSAGTRNYARRIRDEFDAVLVGVNTVLKDNPSLNAGSSWKKLKKIVVDSHLKTPRNAKLFQKTEPENCVIATTRKAKKSDAEYFRKKGVHVLQCPERRGRVDLNSLLKQLAKLEVTSVLFEGGSSVIGSALRDGLVDKMHVYIAPKIVGDQKALSSVEGLNILNINKSLRLKKIEVSTIGEDLLVSGYVHRNR